MVLRTILQLWLLVREGNKRDNSNPISAVDYLDTGKYPDWICGFLTSFTSSYQIVFWNHLKLQLDDNCTGYSLSETWAIAKTSAGVLPFPLKDI